MIIPLKSERRSEFPCCYTAGGGLGGGGGGEML